MMKRFGFLAAVFLFSLFSGLVFAADASLELRSNYSVDDTGAATVDVTLVATDEAAQDLPNSLRMPLAGVDVSNAVVVDWRGDAVESTLVDDGKYIELNSLEDTSGADNNWAIKLTYESQLGGDFGATDIVMIQPLDYGDLSVSKETIEIRADSSLGVGIARGPMPSSSSQSLGGQVLVWTNDEGLIDSTVGVVFGERAVATFETNVRLKNDSWWWKDVEMVLPPDTNQQKVVLTSIEPKPSSLALDIDGNIIAKYKLRPKQEKTVKAAGEIYGYNYSYAIGGSSTVAAIPETLVQDYTQQNDTWKSGQVDWSPTDNPVTATTIQDAYSAVISEILEDTTNFEDALKWSNVMIGELRGVGIPARLVLGKSYINQLPSSQPDKHAWVEAYIPGTGWISADVIAGSMGEQIGLTDVRHVGLAIRGQDPDYPFEHLDDYTFGWQAEDQITDPLPAEPTVKATNNIFLPGLAIHSVDVEMGPGTIIDGAAITIDQSQPIKLGSLAPLQKSTTNTLAFGGAAFTATSVNYGTLSGDVLSGEVAEVVTTNNYVPMFGVIAVVALIIGAVIFYKKRYGSKKDKGKRSKANLVFASEEDGESIERSDLIAEAQKNEPSQKETKEVSEEEARQPVKIEQPKEPKPTKRIEKKNNPPKVAQGGTIKDKKPEVIIGAVGSNPYKKSKRLIQ